MNHFRKNDDIESFGWSKNLLAKVARVYSRSQPVQFMGMFCSMGFGGWLASPSAVFWQPDPEIGHTPYFGLRHDHLGKVLIHDASSAFLTQSIIGIIADNGEICYSRYRQDYYVSEDESVWIDGGRDYVRCSTVEPERIVKITVDASKLVIKQ